MLYQAKEGSLVLDPFVGTGSFLIACSHFKAYTMGADIDGRQLRGKSSFTLPHTPKQHKLPLRTKANKRDIAMIQANDAKCVYDNIQQYKLEKWIMDTMVSDLAHHPWRPVELWDAIVCDVKNSPLLEILYKNCLCLALLN